MDKIKTILDKEYNNLSIPREELGLIKKQASELVSGLKNKIKKLRIKAQVFIGGSFAKSTLIKKNKYDIDIFVRFEKSYSEEEIEKNLKRIIPSKCEKVHGSRDYYRIKKGNTEFEIIPNLSISNPYEARNVTDLSYSHVSYINKKIQARKGLAKEIMLAKAFIHYQGCYGAESYVNGFSGYAVELLITYYKSFINFVRAFSKIELDKNNEKKVIIDIEKRFKNKKEVLSELNESKLNSPIILIDPTFRERNALAALNFETAERLKSACIKFLAKPKIEFFREKDLETEFKVKNKNKIIELEVSTDRQAGDIAGTKLRKFYSFIIFNIKRYFEVKSSEFIYNEQNNKSKILISLNPKKEILFNGPPIHMKESLARFKKEHKNIVINNKRAFAREKGYSSFDVFIKDFQNNYSNTIESMSVNDIKIKKII